MKNKLFFISIIVLSIFCFMNVEAATLNFDKESGIILYALDQKQKDKGLSIPDKYPTSFQIVVSNTNSKIEYTNMNYGRDFQVSNTGLVTLSDSSSYYYGTPLKLRIKIVNDPYLTSDDEIIDTFVTLKSYATQYAEDVMDKYLEENITDDMNEFQKVTKIVEFVVQYPYKVGASSYVSLVISEGGDCWASTSAIVYMCRKLGITASSRAAWFEGGSNHNNVIAIVDGELLVIEAGYNETTVPRHYSITPASNNGWEPSSGKLNQYSGFDTELVMPSNYGTYGTGTFTIIGERAFSYTQNDITSVVLPNTIETIEKEAFFSNPELTYVYIPASVREIGEDVFRDTPKLKSIDIDPNNPYFTYENGIIYNKEKTKIVASLPAVVKGELEFISSVEEIGDFAFAHNRNITGIAITKNVKKIGNSAFVSTELRNITIPSTVEEIGSYAFSGCRLQTIVINSNSDIPIGNYAFRYNNSARLYISNSINASLDNLLDTAKDSYMTVIIGKVNEQKAIEKEVNYEIRPSKIALVNKMLYVEPVDRIIYTGNPITLNYNIHYGAYKLVKDIDYTEEYTNNINSGTATLTITGIGRYAGTITKQFTISRKEVNPIIKFNNIWYGQNVNPTINSIIPIQRTYITYYDSNHNIIQDTPTNIGTYYASVSLTYGNNYESTYDTFKFSIKKGIVVNKTSVAIYKWNKFQLEATAVGNEKVTYESMDPTIASVNSMGLITAKKLGMTKIKVTTPSGKLAVVTVGVYPVRANMVEYENILNQTYTGNNITPKPIIKYLGSTLKEGRDYTLVYSNNKNVGIGKVTIKYIGNYTGSKVLSFVIVPAPISITKLTSPSIGTIRVQYPSSVGASAYQIGYREKGSSTWKYVRTTLLSKNITGLNTNRYEIKVRPYANIEGTNYYGNWSTGIGINVK